jgi:hypothetical protein
VKKGFPVVAASNRSLVLGLDWTWSCQNVIIESRVARLGDFFTLGSFFLKLQK